MRRVSTFSILLALAVSIASSATAAPKTFTGTLTLRLPFGAFSPVVFGSGTGSSDGPFQPATIAGGEFAVHTTVPTSFPPLSAIEVAAPQSPGVPGSNGPLDWDGSSGTMPLNASAFLRGFGTILGAVPLTVIGVGGSQGFSAGFNGTVVGNPYQTGSFFTIGTFLGSPFSFFTRGTDQRTVSGNGRLQLVSPAIIHLSLPAKLPAAAVLDLFFMGPPPANDDFAAATQVTSFPFQDTSDISGATRETNEPSGCFGSNSGTAWWAFTPSETQTVSAIATAPFSTITSVYTGASLGNLSLIACGQSTASFVAELGVTYFIQVGSFGGGGVVQFELDLAPPPVVFDLFFYPFEPTRFDVISFSGFAFDPVNIGIERLEWDFGDGSVATDCCPQHQYTADGQYTVELTAITFDGRSGSNSRVVFVETHDVAITKFSAPTSARTGQSRGITVGINNRGYPDQVQVELFRSTPGGGFAQVGSLTQTVPVRKANRTTDFPFSYTFTQADAAAGKVTFRAVATIFGPQDAFLADNEAIAPPTKVSR